MLRFPEYHSCHSAAVVTPGAHAESPEIEKRTCCWAGERDMLGRIRHANCYCYGGGRVLPADVQRARLRGVARSARAQLLRSLESAGSSVAHSRRSPREANGVVLREQNHSRNRRHAKFRRDTGVLDRGGPRNPFRPWRRRRLRNWRRLNSALPAVGCTGKHWTSTSVLPDCCWRRSVHPTSCGSWRVLPGAGQAWQRPLLRGRTGRRVGARGRSSDRHWQG